MFGALYISQTLHYMVVICGTQFWNDNISRVFFYFFKIFIFSVVRRVKWQKITHNDKKLCLLLSISQELYIMWSWFMVHMCKRVISLGVFYVSFFSCKRVKNGLKWQNIVCCTPYLNKHTSFLLCFLLHKVKMMTSPDAFFIFSKFWLSGLC